MFEVEIAPINKTLKVDPGTNLRQVLIENGLEIKSPCGGCASCGQCIIKVTAKDESLSPINFEEKQLLGNVYHMTKERLSCQTQINGNCSIDISSHVSVEKKTKKVIRKSREEIAVDQEQNTEEVKKVKEGGFKKPRAFKFGSEEEK